MIAWVAEYNRFRICAISMIPAFLLAALFASSAYASEQKTSYDGNWTLVSLDGQKVKPFWTAVIKGSKFVLHTKIPGHSCSTTAKMVVDGRFATLTTTSTNCKGEKVGDVDRGAISLFGRTLTFASHTHNKKWVFVKDLAQAQRTAATRKREAEPSTSLSLGKKLDSPKPVKQSKNPVVVSPPQSPKIVRISPLSPDKRVPPGPVTISWIKRPDALRYFLSIDGTLTYKTAEGVNKSKALFEKALEFYNSTCDVNICSENENLAPGNYTARVDSVYKITSSKVKLEVGAKPAKKKRGSRTPPPPTPPDDILGPVGPVMEEQVSTLQWKPAKGGSTYKLYIQKQGQSPADAMVHMGDAGLLCVSKGPCSVTLSEPLGPGNYIWWFEAEVMSYGKEYSFTVTSSNSSRRRN